eukprot:6178920-Pleurochrysis_carterae.AAC.1
MPPLAHGGRGGRGGRGAAFRGSSNGPERTEPSVDHAERLISAATAAAVRASCQEYAVANAGINSVSQSTSVTFVEASMGARGGRGSRGGRGGRGEPHAASCASSNFSDAAPQAGPVPQDVRRASSSFAAPAHGLERQSVPLYAQPPVAARSSATSPPQSVNVLLSHFYAEPSHYTQGPALPDSQPRPQPTPPVSRPRPQPASYHNAPRAQGARPLPPYPAQPMYRGYHGYHQAAQASARTPSNRSFHNTSFPPPPAPPNYGSMRPQFACPHAQCYPQLHPTQPPPTFPPSAAHTHTAHSAQPSHRRIPRAQDLPRQQAFAAPPAPRGAPPAVANVQQKPADRAPAPAPPTPARILAHAPAAAEVAGLDPAQVATNAS